MISNLDDIDLKDPFGFINVNSIGDSYIEITCIGNNLTVKYSFNNFLGYENRREYFDRNDAKDYNLTTLPSGYYFPISYINFDDFKDELSAYELVNSYEKVKLWRFLSSTNCVELYSDDDPIREIIKTK